MRRDGLSAMLSECDSPRVSWGSSSASRLGLGMLTRSSLCGVWYSEVTSFSGTRIPAWACVSVGG